MIFTSRHRLESKCSNDDLINRRLTLCIDVWSILLGNREDSRIEFDKLCQLQRFRRLFSITASQKV
ncbi:MAG TPA: hypothetical protein DIW81_27825 [Planctomycetaceae bacterium]|nr:hypothetical protein [Rubinisphaera sp.]HCS55348.1 hypothetical protein [Planctomycetaceae bacterium]